MSYAADIYRWLADAEGEGEEEEGGGSPYFAAASSALLRVLNRHQGTVPGLPDSGRFYCRGCGFAYPCPTVFDIYDALY